MDDFPQTRAKRSSADLRSSLIAQTKRRFSPKVRWIALIFACFLVFGNEYILDIPQALQTELEHDVKINGFEYSLLYTVYAAPNIILPLFGGLLVDIIGIKISTILFLALSLLGQAIFAAGCHILSFPLLLVGRIIIGMGGECLTVSQGFLVSLWFKEDELSMSLGVSVYIAKLGTVFNSLITPKLYKADQSLFAPAVAGVFVCLISFLAGTLLLAMNGIRKRVRTYSQDVGELLGGHDEKVSFLDVKKLPLSYWLLFLIALTFEPSFFSFMNVSNQYFQTRFGFTSDWAGDLLIIPYIVAGVLTPFFGWWADNKGGRLKLILGSSMLLVVSHILYALMPDCERCLTTIYPLILFGVFYAVYTSIFYSTVPIMVHRKALGTAFGILTSGLNIGMGLAPIIVGYVLEYYEDVHDTDLGYKIISFILSGISLLGVLAGYSLFKIDRDRGSFLDAGKSVIMVETSHRESTVSDSTSNSAKLNP